MSYPYPLLSLYISPSLYIPSLYTPHIPPLYIPSLYTPHIPSLYPLSLFSLPPLRLPFLCRSMPVP